MCISNFVWIHRSPHISSRKFQHQGYFPHLDSAIDDIRPNFRYIYKQALIIS